MPIFTGAPLASPPELAPLVVTKVNMDAPATAVTPSARKYFLFLIINFPPLHVERHADNPPEVRASDDRSMNDGLTVTTTLMTFKLRSPEIFTPALKELTIRALVRPGNSPLRFHEFSTKRGGASWLMRYSTRQSPTGSRASPRMASTPAIMRASLRRSIRGATGALDGRAAPKNTSRSPRRR